MTSEAYGWYRQGEFAQINRPQLVAMALCACVSSVLFSLLFLLVIERFLSGSLLAAMKVASALVSFYVAKLLWNEIKVRREDPPGIEQSRPLTVDWRIYPWIAVGALLNVTTAVGIGGTWLLPHHEILRCVRKEGHRCGRHDAGRFGSQPDRDHYSY